MIKYKLLQAVFNLELSLATYETQQPTERALGIYLRSIWHVTYRFPCALALLIFPLIYEK